MDETEFRLLEAVTCVLDDTTNPPFRLEDWPVEGREDAAARLRSGGLLVEHRRAQGDPPGTYYRVTDAGYEALAAEMWKRHTRGEAWPSRG